MTFFDLPFLPLQDLLESVKLFLNRDYRPSSHCNKKLEWEEVRDNFYFGLYTHCIKCDTSYLLKLYSPFFPHLSPQLYKKGAGKEESMRHVRCGSKTTKFRLPSDDEDPRFSISRKPGKGLFTLENKVSEVIYCPDCEQPMYQDNRDARSVNKRS